MPARCMQIKILRVIWCEGSNDTHWTRHRSLHGLWSAAVNQTSSSSLSWSSEPIPSALFQLVAALSPGFSFDALVHECRWKTFMSSQTDFYTVRWLFLLVSRVKGKTFCQIKTMHTYLPSTLETSSIWRKLKISITFGNLFFLFFNHKIPYYCFKYFWINCSQKFFKRFTPRAQKT